MAKRLRGFQRNGLPYANEPGSSLSHLVGAGLSVAALVLMVVFGAQTGGGARVTSLTIFGASLVLLYSVSGFYHAVHATDARKWVWQKLDHAMIFILIAGTYTPITLVLLGGAWGWSLFGVVWGVSLIAFVLRMTVGERIPSWVFLVLYIALGWVVVVALRPLLDALSSAALMWLVGGGVLYTIGATIYGMERRLPRTRWLGPHELFHLFVMGGSFAHFWLMLRYVA